jgi:hypothetical protein
LAGAEFVRRNVAIGIIDVWRLIDLVGRVMCEPLSQRYDWVVEKYWVTVTGFPDLFPIFI